ncbi:hypothetical protein [Pseudosulfitobacter pseudonitzschiae]|uniref:hypothetical protein n=1 Tax=Pseudosulfitobacter pseudonitzschiae TaxID=1402135 RepID=UPI003B8193DB
MPAANEKTFDVLISDIGEARLVLRPPLPFHAEGYRLNGANIEIFGDGLAMSRSLDPESMGEMDNIHQALLIEFDATGGDSVRETELEREDSL